jgi:site-specific DNA-methyltransferase (adenine-specific)
MKPVSYLAGKVTLYRGDCVRVLRQHPENIVDSICCDPPYHLESVLRRFGGDGPAPKTGKTGAYKRVSAGFMGKTWDAGDIAFRPSTWREAFRVLKPGGYIIAFASARGYGRMQVAMEAAGFVTLPMIGQLLSREPQIAQFLSSLSEEQAGAFFRLVDQADPLSMLGWIFGSGFPKATKIKAPGYEGFRYGGQALKPALEPIYMGQKPFSEASGTKNIGVWGTGAINIDGCRIETTDDLNGGAYARSGARDYLAGDERTGKAAGMFAPGRTVGTEFEQPPGRWPANVVHDGSAAVIAEFPLSDGQRGDIAPDAPSNASDGKIYNRMRRHGEKSSSHRAAEGGATPIRLLPGARRLDAGSAARFFYSSKAGAMDRAGLKHPTVKPLDLMQHLVRLITPPGGLVLDLFAGTGTTGEAAWREGMRAVLIEKDASYCEDIATRMHLAENPAKRAAIVKAKGRLRGAEDTPLFEAAE